MNGIKVNSVVNSTGDNDSGIDLSTNEPSYNKDS